MEGELESPGIRPVGDGRSSLIGGFSTAWGLHSRDESSCRCNINFSVSRNLYRVRGKFGRARTLKPREVLFGERPGSSWRFARSHHIRYGVPTVVGHSYNSWLPLHWGVYSV